MRKELEPDMKIAKELYLQIVKLIEEYTNYCDENGDEENIEHEKLENKLHTITGKDISEYNLFEYWEDEGLEPLAFKIALPNPIIVKDIKKDELIEIVKRIKEGIFEKNDEDKFTSEFKYFTEEYYHKLLEMNYKNYTNEYFQRQKGNDGKYFEYSVEEIVQRILDKK